MSQKKVLCSYLIVIIKIAAYLKRLKKPNRIQSDIFRHNLNGVQLTMKKDIHAFIVSRARLEDNNNDDGDDDAGREKRHSEWNKCPV